ncbi:long-chain-acyl-CoA synthetase [Prosthecomicrobium hirschii]|uniref:long-chain-acyl-CoA synthetase n=1 Tax=Prosthecodimorpha hirschii TaxID=665126 RepID=UPI000A8EF3F9|nr:long-chain-acyl-CoA synthetase [Prosthecomicrobium hirschii]
MPQSASPIAAMPRPDAAEHSRADATAPAPSAPATPAPTTPPSVAPLSALPSPSKRWLMAIERVAAIDAAPERLLADAIADRAAADGTRPALISETETFTYADLSARVARYARWALQAGIAPGDRVALVMSTRPDYLAAWIGITTVGGLVALVNTQLAGASLAHALNVAAPAHVIAEAPFAAPVAEAIAGLAPAPRLWIFGGDRDDLAVVLDRLPGDPLAPHERRPVGVHDRALLIYTSGTTGLPKAAHVSHHRILSWGHWFAGLSAATPDDRLYDCLPIHHSVGGVVATASMLVSGGSVVLAEKFSASRFWADVVRHDCTLFQYIGELCRYLLKAPPHPDERRHRLRLACGNGLRGDVWEPFQARFGIPDILEFYAATEGNFSLFNVEGRPGAIGRIPPFLSHRFPAAIVRFDPDAGLPLRGPDGLCLKAARGEAGEALGRIATAAGGGRFEGYTSPEETERKVLRDVFAPGDAWFRTGDLMRIDEKGFWYFVDRIGDTFRWKGENVATAEVAAAIAAVPGVVDATVYGVAVPGADGRAGMATLVTEPGFDLGALHRHLAGTLPAYARPLFLRLATGLALTETFKQKKQDLVRDGFDPAAIPDPLFVDDPATGAYRPLDADRHRAIVEGRIRL